MGARRGSDSTAARPRNTDRFDSPGEPPLLCKWKQSELDGRREAAGRSDAACLANEISIQLGQPIDESVEILRTGMLSTVKAFVRRDVFQPKITTQIYN